MGGQAIRFDQMGAQFDRFLEKWQVSLKGSSTQSCLYGQQVSLNCKESYSLVAELLNCINFAFCPSAE